MPKTDIKKIESEDLKELSDEALDRAGDAQHCGGNTVACVVCCAPSE